MDETMKHNTEDLNRLAVAVFDKLDTHYQSKYMNTTVYLDTFEQFCPQLPRLLPDMPLLGTDWVLQPDRIQT
jgi:hypothetical protein